MLAPAEPCVGQSWPHATAQQGSLGGKAGDHYEALCQCEVLFMCKNHNILRIWPLDIVSSNKHPCPAQSALFPLPPKPRLRLPSQARVFQGWLVFIFNLGMCDSKPA